MTERSRRPELEREVPFHVMTMPTGPACNLECEYCYYLDKSELYPGRGDFRMSEDTLEEFIKQYIEAQPGPQITFAWQGGEPTLRGIEFYRKAVRLQQEYAPTDTHIVNSIQTNGFRLDEEWCEFFAENDFFVGISIDGPRELHDRYRKTRNDKPTFDEVMNGLSLLQKYDIEYNVLCSLNDYNSQYPLRIYEFFKEQGVEWIQFIPLVEFPSDSEIGTGSSDSSTLRTDLDKSDRPVYPWVRERADLPEDVDDGYQDVLDAAKDASTTAWSVDPAVYSTFLRTIFEEWIRNDIGNISIQLFDQCLEITLTGEASLCVHNETCGDQVAMEHNGDVYACDHFVDPGFKRGNIHQTHLTEMLDSEEQRKFGEYKRRGLPARCQECPVLEFCHGGCPKNRHITTPAGDFGLNYLCAGYRSFFRYVQPYLEIIERTIQENKPLPLVMDEVTVRDNHLSS
ncbi:anaerobic sulfatase maturase [Halorhabdus amylolytica]|uniref:anaerobic sulfatase maturase n=1 Tax=Halorhabdus amylolytica TaxID=2559573 RepID=UPI00145BA6D5|nr:anaerobic sulfatase maturase [Halorhabdus amylolytica]